MSVPMLPLLRAEDLTPEQAFAFLGSYMSIAMFAAAIDWLYFSLMESSSKQATLGKLALGLRVTGNNGRRISFGRATGRYFAHFLTNLTLLIGYVIQVFTSRRQALHDLIAGTLVTRSES
jgi:uncharacterized RDD family membrane protein YckC